MNSSMSCVLLVTMLLSTSAILVAGLTIRAELTHVDTGRGFTSWELLNRMAARSRARAAIIHHRGGGGGRRYYVHPATVPVAPGTVGNPGTEYLIHFGIGTPQPQLVALTLDTGSDLVWTQCVPCISCFDQPLPMFEPSASKTFRAVWCYDPICAESNVAACYLDNHVCFYLDSYGDKSITAGSICRDTVTFKAPDGGKAVVADFAFGCGQYNKGVFNTNESGIAGFGRGPQSMPSQLKVGKFSYCFTSMLESGGKSSPVFLGTPDDLRAHATGPIQSTPMLRRRENVFYYLMLKGVTVGKTRLPITGGNSSTGGTTIIDSGTGISSFPLAVFDQMAAAFKSQMDLPVASNESETGGLLCFELPEGGDAAEKVSVPKLVFHLEGADMDLPRENYMFSNTKLMCLIIQGSEGDTNMIGNFQMQNMHIVYDVENSKLLFAPAQCDRL